MSYVTRDQFLTRFKNMETIGLDEMISVIQEMFDCSVTVKKPLKDRNKEITKALFSHPKVIQDLREAAMDTELIETEEEFMRIGNEVRNG